MIQFYFKSYRFHASIFMAFLFNVIPNANLKTPQSVTLCSIDVCTYEANYQLLLQLICIFESMYLSIY